MGDVGVQAGEKLIGEMKKLGNEIKADEGILIPLVNQIAALGGAPNDLASKDFEDFRRELSRRTLEVQRQQAEIARSGGKADPFAVVMAQMQLLGEKSQALEEHMKGAIPKRSCPAISVSCRLSTMN